MALIGIVGSGNVGANTAFFAAEKNIAPIRMYDIKEGLSTGKALDMMEAAPIREYQFQIDGTDDLNDVTGAEVIIIAAGVVREPGMKRSDLYPTNRAGIEKIASQLTGFAGVVVVVTEPVDHLVRLVVETSGVPWQRVLGLGGALDSMRLRYLIAGELKVATGAVAATVVGSHSDEMIPLARYTTVSGVPITALLTQDRIDHLFEETRRAGDTILDHFKRATSYYGPAAAASDVAEAVIRDSHRILSVSFMLTGQYGISDVSMSLPAVIGREGVIRVLEPRLSEQELSQFTASSAAVAAGR
ncbi:MAG: malate dehydrogenase [Spirochaetia bacterium]